MECTSQMQVIEREWEWKKTHTENKGDVNFLYVLCQQKKIMFTVQTGTYYNEVESTVGTYAEYVNIYIDI